ncbi:F-box/LRR-repeat protein At5g63520-like isoform X2 [Mangifera indica]|uniref:F-box/LRR-repeat protein At5g63520-like isoform X2 n=1 Tax=Mangifera indica TaxID=29780 RepID=UPI001CF9B66E|nr:F-box/LRR-repeat protein At5g63520-like isoform X2 [Mangifera indica]
MDTGQPSSSSNNYKTDSGLVLKNEDLLYSILCKLPARSFASSAWVCKIWHKVCNQILARPKIASAFSLHTTSRIAVNEVVDKVLSAPIRPHFAIANVGSGFHFNQTIQWLARGLGSQTPIIVSHARGIMGRHAVTDQFQEAKFADFDYHACIHEGSTGILLIVGSVPGVKVDAIPLLKLKRIQGKFSSIL